MTLDEELRLAKTAAMRPEWQNARLAMVLVLVLNTTMSGCEIKALRWYDVDFLNSTATIRKSKTQAGLRVIPLNEDALSCMTGPQRYRGCSPITTSFPRVRMVDLTLRRPRRVGAQLGEA
jgi:integrase